MGRQINFYMTPSDEEEFLRFLKADRDVCVFMDGTLSSEVQPIESLPEKGIPGWFMLFLWDTENSPPPKMNYVPEQKHYVVDSTVSEVIEFLRCFMHEDRLVRGRIWAEMVGWHAHDPATPFEKSDKFKKWFDRLASWIRRRSVKDRVGDYLLPGAAEYVNTGGKTCQVALAKHVKVIHHPVD